MMLASFSLSTQFDGHIGNSFFALSFPLFPLSVPPFFASLFLTCFLKVDG